MVFCLCTFICFKPFAWSQYQHFKRRPPKQGFSRRHHQFESSMIIDMYLIIFDDHVHLKLLSSVGNLFNFVLLSPDQSIHIDLFSDLLCKSFKKFGLFSLINLNVENDDGLCNNDLLGLGGNSLSFLSLSSLLGSGSLFFVVISKEINIFLRGGLLLFFGLLLLLSSLLLLLILFGLLWGSPEGSDVGLEGRNDKIPEVGLGVEGSVRDV
jgi:hypothetical protein